MKMKEARKKAVEATLESLKEAKTATNTNSGMLECIRYVGRLTALGRPGKQKAFCKHFQKELPRINKLLQEAAKKSIKYINSDIPAAELRYLAAEIIIVQEIACFINELTKVSPDFKLDQETMLRLSVWAMLAASTPLNRRMHILIKEYLQAYPISTALLTNVECVKEEL